MAHHNFVLASIVAMGLVMPGVSVCAAKKGQDSVQRLLIKRQYKSAFTQLQASAKAGNAKAQYRLANLYRLGLGVAVDRDKATYWYGKAAEGGNAQAQRILKRQMSSVPKTEVQPSLRGNAPVGEGTPNFKLLTERNVQGQNWLTLAAARGLVGAIDALSREQAEAFKGAAGQALLAAAQSGKADAVGVLLSKGTSPDTRNAAGETASMVAASFGRVDALKALLAASPDLFANDGSGIGALGKTSIDCNPVIFKILLAAGVKDKEPRTPPLTRILQNCSQPETYFKDARPNALNEIDASGRSVFWHAAGKLDALTLNSLLAAGANPELEDLQGFTPLHAAAIAGRADNIAVLLNAVSDAAAPTKNGTTALMLAAYVGCVDCVQKLANGASGIDAKDAAGNSALMYALLGKQRATANQLVSLGANLNAQNESGDTPRKLGKRIATVLGD